MKNSIIRIQAKRHNVFLWEVAEALGISDTHFSRKLRHELSEEETSRILTLIEKMGGEKDAREA